MKIREDVRGIFAVLRPTVLRNKRVEDVIQPNGGPSVGPADTGNNASERRKIEFVS